MNRVDREYNWRQLALMQDAIGRYESGGLALGPLIEGLGALNSALNPPLEVFTQAFEPLWGQFEVVHAMMCDEGRFELNEIDAALIREGIFKLRNLVSETLKALD